MEGDGLPHSRRALGPNGPSLGRDANWLQHRQSEFFSNSHSLRTVPGACQAVHSGASRV